MDTNKKPSISREVPERSVVLLDRPRLNLSVYQSTDVLQFRHPWCPAKMLRFGIKKLTRTDRLEFAKEAQTLLDRVPKDRVEAPAGIRQKLLDKYFKVIDDSEMVHVITVGTDGEIEQRKHKDSETQFLMDQLEMATLKRDIGRLKRENRNLRQRVEELTKALGDRTDAEKSTTLQRCWERFQERFQCQPGSKPEQRRDVLRRVKCVLDRVGWDRRFGEIEKTHLAKALDATKPRSETEKSKRIRDLKRFFTFLCKPKSEDGLGFVNNPAAGLSYLGDRELQRRRRAYRGIPTFADPGSVLLRLDLYWRALMATLLYSGVRLAEAAALSWDRIDFDDRVIEIRPSKVYRNLKSGLSERSVKPFRELWPVLEAHCKAKLHDHWVFPHEKDHAKTWFVEYHGEPRLDHLSQSLPAALRKARVGSKTS